MYPIWQIYIPNSNSIRFIYQNMSYTRSLSQLYGQALSSSSSWCPRIAVHSSHQQCTASRYITSIYIYLIYRPSKDLWLIICFFDQNKVGNFYLSFGFYTVHFSGCLLFCQKLPKCFILIGLHDQKGI